MKKRIIKILILLAIIFLGIQINSYAAVVTSTDKSVEGGNNVTISINAKQPLGAYKVSLVDAGGLTFVSASGGTTSNGSLVTGSSDKGITSLASYTFKTPVVQKDTKYTVKFKISTMADVDLNKIPEENNTATITVKAKATTPPPSEGNTGGGTTEKPVEEKPTFTDVKETVYTTSKVNVRESYSKSSKNLGSLEKGEEVTRTGKGSNGWSRITFKGKTAYVSSSYLTTTKPTEEEKSNNKALKSLSIEGVNLSPEFDPEITNYEVQVDESITELKINAIAADEKSKVEITGNTDLKEGENTVTIKVTAEDETVRNYMITAIKGEKLPFGLTTLNVGNGELTPTFQTDIYEYELVLTEDLATIEIDAILDLEGASVEVLGNEDLIDGSVITVLVYSGEKDAEDTQVAEYKITVKKNLASTIVTDASKELIMPIGQMIYIGTIIILTAAIIALLTARYFTTKQEKSEEEQDDWMQDQKVPNEAEESEPKPLDQEEKIEEDTVEKKTKSKGKHSL